MWLWFFFWLSVLITSCTGPSPSLPSSELPEDHASKDDGFLAEEGMVEDLSTADEVPDLTKDGGGADEGSSEDVFGEESFEDLYPSGDLKIEEPSPYGCLSSYECGVGFYCLDGQCVPWVCVPYSRECEGTLLKTCSKEGDGWKYEECDDGDPCTVGDGCADRHCVKGHQVDCDDKDPCTFDLCDPTSGQCAHTPSDGNPCDDGDPCTEGDICVFGLCVGKEKDCDDKNLCTDDTCEPIVGCRHRPNQALCDDGNACTVNDRCDLGVCIGTFIDLCDDKDPCTIDLCDPQSGLCLHEESPSCSPCKDDLDCDDKNLCSEDRCEGGSCVHIPSGALGCCASDEACSHEDPCIVGTCDGAPFGRCRFRTDPSCCEEVVYKVEFSGEDHFILDEDVEGVGWHVTSAGQSHSPPWALYYGNEMTGNYSTGDAPNSGTATSKEVALPVGASVKLAFYLWMDVEPTEGKDLFFAQAITDTGTYEVFRRPPDFPMKTWVMVSKDISLLQGHVVRFAFRFDTVDGVANDGAGVYVDDIEVRSPCKPKACSTDMDCLSLSAIGRCIGGSCDFSQIFSQVQSIGGLSGPYDLSVLDAHVYVADEGNNRIVVFGPDGSIVKVFGSKGSSEGAFMAPHGLYVTHERLYVADTGNHRVQVFTPRGVFLFAFGRKGSAEGEFLDPKAVAVQGEAGVILVADTSNHRVQVFDPDGHFVLAFGGYGKKDGQFRSPSCVRVGPDGLVYVCDSQNNRIQVFSMSGEFIRKVQGSGQYALDSPYGLALRSDGLLFVADTLHHRIVVFSPEGLPLGAFGSYGSGLGEFRHPMGLWMTLAGRLYVTDSSNGRVSVYDWTAFP